MSPSGKLHRCARSMVIVLYAYMGIGAIPAQATGDVPLVTGEFPPFTGENLPNGGMLTELVTTVFYNLGYTPSVTYLPWKRGYQETLDTEFFGTFPYSYSQERAEEMYYSAPLRENNVYLFVRASSTLEYSSLEDLRGARFCTALGYNIFPPIQEAVDQGIISLVTVRQMGNCVRMMEIDRADAIFLAEEAGWLTIEQEIGSRHRYRKLPNPIYTVREYLIVSRHYPNATELIDEFNRELQRFASTDAYRLMIHRWKFGPASQAND